MTALSNIIEGREAFLPLYVKINPERNIIELTIKSRKDLTDRKSVALFLCLG